MLAPYPYHVAFPVGDHQNRRRRREVGGAVPAGRCPAAARCRRDRVPSRARRSAPPADTPRRTGTRRRTPPAPPVRLGPRRTRRSRRAPCRAVSGPSSRRCPAPRRTCTAPRARPASATRVAGCPAWSPGGGTAGRRTGCAAATARTRRTSGPAARPTAAAAARAPGSPRPARPAAAPLVALVVGVAGEQRAPVEVVQVDAATGRTGPGQRLAEHVAEPASAQRGELAHPAQIGGDPVVDGLGGQAGELRIVEQAVGHLADGHLHQPAVDDVVAGDVPQVRVPPRRPGRRGAARRAASRGPARSATARSLRWPAG